MKYQEEEVSCYQETSLEDYLNAMFGYYEAQGIANDVSRIDTKTVDGGASTVYRSLFETILAKYGLELKDATFEEIMEGDYYRVLRRYGLIDISNNPSFESLGGVV